MIKLSSSSNKFLFLTFHKNNIFSYFFNGWTINPVFLSIIGSSKFFFDKISHKVYSFHKYLNISVIK